MARNALQESCPSIDPVRLGKLAMYRVDHNSLILCEPLSCLLLHFIIKKRP